MGDRAKPGVVIYVRRLGAMTAFYAGVTGLAITRTEETYTVLESAGHQVVLLRAPDDGAEAIDVEATARRRTETPIKPVFVVRSIAASREAAVELGGELNAREREWRFEGARVCDGQDPEGNVFQLRERVG